MSKWNTKTEGGGIVDISALVSTKPVDHFDEAFNKPQDVTTQTTKLLFDSKEGSPWWKQRKAKRFFCVFIAVVIFAILLGVLYPRYPTVDVNRAATAKTMSFDRNINGSIDRIQGNVTLTFSNTNVYTISLAGMDITGLIGAAPNSLPFNDSIGALEIPGNAASVHIIPIAIDVPPSMNLAQFTLSIVAQCVANQNMIKSVVSGVARINVLGSVIPYSFGPLTVSSPCLQ